MKKQESIVFLDAGTLDFGDIDFGILQSLGSVRIYRNTMASQVLQRARQAQRIIANKVRFDRDLLRQLPRLKSIHVAATGVNNVDLRAARDLSVSVSNVSGYSTETVVQFTVAFILALAGNLTKYDAAVKKGAWSRSPFFTLGSFPIMEVHGKTLGIVGYGSIGRRVAGVARALGMNVLVARIPGRKYAQSSRPRRLSLQRVCEKCDFLSIHAPLSDLTKGLICLPLMRKMKQSAFIINMARGGIVVEKDLLNMLKKNRLQGAATDVLTQEPPPGNHLLLKAPRTLLTPHIAWASREARTRLINEIALNIRAAQAGRKRNRIA